MNADDRLFCNRIMEAADNCYHRNIPTATDFLDLYKQSLFNNIVNELPPVHHMVMGGYDLAERKIIRFLPYAGYSCELPYKVIQIKPVNRRFAEPLTHRDCLGAILNLGVSRDKTGDILVMEDNIIFFCSGSISDYLAENIIRIKHTDVNAAVVEPENFSYEPEYEEITGSVASLRLDAVIALGFKISRSHIITYIEDGKTAVNGRIICSNAYILKQGDIISVRGLGKICFDGSVHETKKGRIMIKIKKYI